MTVGGVGSAPTVSRLSGTARRDVLILSASRGVTQFGSMLTLIAVALELQPRGAGTVAVAMAAELVPAIVLGPVAGRLLDRVPNRPVMVTAYLAQATAAFLLALLLHHLAAVVVLLAVVGTAAAVAGPAQSALVPVAAGERHAPVAFGYLSTAGTVGFLTGLACAGVLVQAVGPRGALAVDGATYLVEAGAVALLRARRTPAPAPAGGNGRTTAGPGEGLRVLGRDGVLRVVLPGLGVALLASSVVNVASVFLVVEELRAPPALYGLVEAAWGVGALLGAWWAGRVTGDAQHARTVLLGGITMGCALAGAGLLVSVPATMVAWVVGGAANSMQNVGSQALISARVPARLHGSAFGAFVAVLQTSNVASLLLGSLVVSALGAPATLVVSGAAAALASLAALAVLRVTRAAEGGSGVT